jgi:hypothetical protein
MPSVVCFRHSNNVRKYHDNVIESKLPELLQANFIAKAQRNPLKAKTVEEKEDFLEDTKNTKYLVGSAVAFAGIIAILKGIPSSIEFMSGYILELTLSVDNLIVFLLLFDFFKVDKESEKKILTYGIVGAIILRGLFIGAGAVALSQFKQVLLLFAAVLFYSSFKILANADDDDEVDTVI